MEITLVIGSLIGSVLLGGGIVSFLNSSNNQRFIKLLLAFSGGFLLSIAFIHFIPELYEHGTTQVGIFILLGFLIQMILELFSGGIEHGHVHHHHASKIPWAIVLALTIHSFLEGIPLASGFSHVELATSHHHEGDNSLLFGILFHRLPVAVALMTLLMTSHLKPITAWLILCFFAITAPLGMLVGYLTHDVFQQFDFNLILCVVVGMFLHISTTIIFETSENHKFNFIKLLSILAGFGIALSIH